MASLIPILGGPLLLALTLGPPEVRAQLVDKIPSSIPVDAVILALKVIVPLGFVVSINNFLNNWALRNWQWSGDNKKDWVWGQEVAVVTGGSNGIGAATAERLANRGVKVAVLDVVPPNDGAYNAKAAANIKFFECNLRKRESIAKAAEEVRSTLGHPSILINNAGIGNAGDILDATPEGLHAIFDINLIAQWFTIQEFLPDMLKKNKGHILSVSSMSAFVGIAGIADYCAIKAGLTALHESLNQELKWRYKKTGIRTSIVYPLWTRTRLAAELEEDIKKASAIPILDVGTVGDAMANQILNDKRGRIFLPNSLRSNAAPGVRGLPWWIQEFVRDDTKNFVIQKGSTSAGAPVMHTSERVKSG